MNSSIFDERRAVVRLKDISEALGASEQRTWALARAGHWGPMLHLGRAVYVRRDKFLEWLNAQGEEGAANAE